jgi:hypothetical protein
VLGWSGRSRSAFLSSGSPHQPLAEFLAADDDDEMHELVAVIGGVTEPGGCAAPATHSLASTRNGFRTEMYSERIVDPGAWNKAVVVAGEDDEATMLNHALIQGRRRYRS